MQFRAEMLPVSYTHLDVYKRQFAFPSKQNGLKNVAACNGQQISIKSNKYKAMHILALSAEDASGNISIQYKDRNVETPFKTIGWNTVPAGAAIPAIKTNYRYSADGIVRQPAYINPVSYTHLPCVHESHPKSLEDARKMCIRDRDTRVVGIFWIAS